LGEKTKQWVEKQTSTNRKQTNQWAEKKPYQWVEKQSIA
jgi:hypothetical protein